MSYLHPIPPLACFYSATLAWNLSAVDRRTEWIEKAQLEEAKRKVISAIKVLTSNGPILANALSEEIALVTRLTRDESIEDQKKIIDPGKTQLEALNTLIKAAERAGKIYHRSVLALDERSRWHPYACHLAYLVMDALGFGVEGPTAQDRLFVDVQSSTRFVVKIVTALLKELGENQEAAAVAEMLKRKNNKMKASGQTTEKS